MYAMMVFSWGDESIGNEYTGEILIEACTRLSFSEWYTVTEILMGWDL